MSNFIKKAKVEKTNVETVDFEPVPIDELEDEVAAEIAENDTEPKAKETVKERGKRYLKTAGKVAIGAVVGFGVAVVAGIAMNRKADEEDLDYYESFEGGNNEVTEEDTEE